MAKVKEIRQKYKREILKFPVSVDAKTGEFSVNLGNTTFSEYLDMDEITAPSLKGLESLFAVKWQEFIEASVVESRIIAVELDTKDNWSHHHGNYQTMGKFEIDGGVYEVRNFSTGGREITKAENASIPENEMLSVGDIRRGGIEEVEWTAQREKNLGFLLRVGKAINRYVGSKNLIQLLDNPDLEEELMDALVNFQFMKDDDE